MRYIFLLLIFFPCATKAQVDSLQRTVPFSTDSIHLTAWNGERYVPFFIKGINLGVSVPGTYPGELAATAEDYQRWFQHIRDAGFNVIRLYTLHFPRFYYELVAFNESNPEAPLYFTQGIWLEEEIPNYDHDLYTLSSLFHQEMLANVRSVHGDTVIPQRFGKAHGMYNTDASRYCLAYLMGREIFPDEILNANSNRPNVTAYSGSYLSISNVQAAEVFLTAHMDSLIQFEFDEYSTMRPVSVSSWPTLDPISHPEESYRQEDTAQIDLSEIDLSNAPGGVFISYHAYPYYPDFISKTASYRTFSDELGQNSYLGYLTDLKSHYQQLPLIIAEFGIPSSWGVAHYSASDMNHGGHTEREQGEGGLRMLRNIKAANCGGGIYFAWLDEWFKQTWITNPLETNPGARIRWPNFTSAEQNFGLLGYTDTVATWQLIDTCSSCRVKNVYAQPTVGDFRIYLDIEPVFREDDTLWIAFDTYADDRGEELLPTGDTLQYRSEFLLKLVDGRAELYVMRSYDLFGIWHGTSDPDQLYRSTPSSSGDWRLVRWRNNQPDQDVQYIGNLDITDSFRGQSSKDAVVIDTNEIFVRIPWTLLQVSDPSQRVVIDDNRSTPQTEYDTTGGIHLEVLLGNERIQTTNRVTWPTYILVDQVVERDKLSYQIMKAGLPTLPDFTLARVDNFTVEGFISVANTEGVLSNDEQWDGGEMEVVLRDAPQNGLLQLRSNGSFDYQAQPGFLGHDSFTYSVFSRGDFSTPATVNLNVVSSSSSDVILRVGPVPTDDVLYVYSEVEVDRVNVYNSVGQLVHESESRVGDFEIDVKGLASGHYIVQFEVGEDIWVRKITVK
ncbi:MAG: T9SS type A sorting domain-containing protein [Flavobacteriia bacterium]|nr:T9SS type A sorting domain-containing protein [Flavobacteriia bacterium]